MGKVKFSRFYFKKLTYNNSPIPGNFLWKSGKKVNIYKIGDSHWQLCIGENPGHRLGYDETILADRYGLKMNKVETRAYPDEAYMLLNRWKKEDFGLAGFAAELFSVEVKNGNKLGFLDPLYMNLDDKISYFKKKLFKTIDRYQSIDEISDGCEVRVNEKQCMVEVGGNCKKVDLDKFMNFLKYKNDIKLKLLNQVEIGEDEYRDYLNFQMSFVKQEHLSPVMSPIKLSPSDRRETTPPIQKDLIQKTPNLKAPSQISHAEKTGDYKKNSLTVNVENNYQKKNVGKHKKSVKQKLPAKYEVSSEIDKNNNKTTPNITENKIMAKCTHSNSNFCFCSKKSDKKNQKQKPLKFHYPKPTDPKTDNPTKNGMKQLSYRDITSTNKKTPQTHPTKKLQTKPTDSDKKFDEYLYDKQLNNYKNLLDVKKLAISTKETLKQINGTLYF